MCFYKSKESKILVAKRNIIVYKLGCFADSDIFNPVYNESYCYYKNKMTKENVYFNDDIMFEGFHSYITCIIKILKDLTYIHSLFIRINSLNNYLDNTMLLNKDRAFLGKFIIPKGATYCINISNEVISNSIIYTGNYIKLINNMDFNAKDLWKDK